MGLLGDTFKKVGVILGVGTPSTDQLGEALNGHLFVDLDGRLMAKDLQGNLRLIANANANLTTLNQFSVDGSGILNFGSKRLSNHEIVNFDTLTYADSSDVIPLTNLINKTTDIFTVTSNKTITFIQAGTYYVEVKILGRVSLLDGTHPRLRTTAGHATMTTTTGEGGWYEVRLAMPLTIGVGFTLELAYNNGKFDVYGATGFSYINIIKIG